MTKNKKASLIQAAVPHERGAAVHIEHPELAVTVFDKKGKVKEIYTPPSTVKRIHEVLHARYSDPGLDRYKGIREEVAQITEDCVIHTLHWPWKVNETPTSILTDVLNEMSTELSHSKEMEQKGFNFAAFATKLRAAGVLAGAIGWRNSYKGLSGHASFSELALISTILTLIQGEKFNAAAALLEAAFFFDPEKHMKKKKATPSDKEGKPEESGSEESDSDSSGDAEASDEAHSKLLKSIGGGRRLVTDQDMNIITLQLTEQIDQSDKGFRLAASGPRIYRPALRRPTLPQKLFMKPSPQYPSGAILFDASNSMRVTHDVLVDCCLRAPAATVAFYNGSDSSGYGTLYIFAKDGVRAKTIPPQYLSAQGNGVDGPALNWLLNQEGEKKFVTDRGFCGSSDSFIQRYRLDKLERENEVSVYPSFADFQEKHPKLIRG